VRVLVETKEEAAELLAFERDAGIIATNPRGSKSVELKGTLTSVRTAIIDARSQLVTSRLTLWEPHTAKLDRLELRPRTAT
jgi:hypothetical protein